MNTLDTITPILTATYGKGGMVTDLAVHLAAKIDNYEPRPEDERDSRERMIWMTCWDWMTGGLTSESVARKIEAALTEAARP